MKYISLIFSLFLLNSCNKAKALTYEEGLGNCNRIQEEKQKENPDALYFTSADCIIGSQIPDFEATTIEGNLINRASLQGKPSILNFWFITCPPCVAEIPGFNAIVEKFGTDQINYIAFGRDSEKDIQEFLIKNPWHFDLVPDGAELIKDQFKIRWGFPTTFLLNKNAEIVMAFSGGKTDSTAVQEIQNKLIPLLEKELK